MMMKLS